MNGVVQQHLKHGPLVLSKWREEWNDYLIYPI